MSARAACQPTSRLNAPRTVAPPASLIRKRRSSLRALVAILVVATFIAAGDERMKRLAAAFDWPRRDAACQFPHPAKFQSIALTEDPEGQARGAMKLYYKVEDDYGVVKRAGRL